MKNVLHVLFFVMLLFNVICIEKNKNDIKSDRINNIDYKMNLNPNKYSCDIAVIQSVSFSFLKPTNVIYFTIVSSEHQLYNFSSYLDNDSSSNSIVKFESYVDKTFNDKSYMDQNNVDIKFKERWVLITYLANEVTDVNINYTYLSERSILINNNDKTNFLRLTIFNPYDHTISYGIFFDIVGFENLDITQLRLPADVSVKIIKPNLDSNNLNLNTNDYGIELSTNKMISTHNQYELYLSLPQQISDCDIQFMQVIFYSMLGISCFFIISTVLTVYYLSKE